MAKLTNDQLLKRIKQLEKENEALKKSPDQYDSKASFVHDGTKYRFKKGYGKNLVLPDFKGSAEEAVKLPQVCAALVNAEYAGIEEVTTKTRQSK